MATCAPAEASARAMARPMPREPPVTNATFRLSVSAAFSIRAAAYNTPRMQEVAIVGAGELGGLLAHVLARRDAARAIRLVDESGQVAAGKALDIMQASPLEQFATSVSGGT